MATTIREVAKRAGVSIATVSRVLNDVGPVDGQTRLRVQKAARELLYIPNLLGRGLSRQKTEALGLLLPDLFGEFFSEVIRGADETAQEHRYHLVVSSSHSNREEIEAALRMMRGRVDGLVIMSPHIDAQTLDRNLPHNLPVTLLNCHVEGEAFDSLNIDNFGGAYQLTRHLLDHGHKRIAILKGTEHNLDAEERLRGYRQALLTGGGEIGDHWEAPGNFTEASGFEAVRRILGASPRPSAIFASNDSMAIGALSALRDAGVHVPGEIALAGFDDIPVCAYLSPSLTSVHVGVHDLGVLAIKNVLHAVEEKEVHQKRQAILQTTLALRESCGCPDGAHTS
jgi:LacI family transcriptional regulator